VAQNSVRVVVGDTLPLIPQVGEQAALRNIDPQGEGRINADDFRKQGVMEGEFRAGITEMECASLVPWPTS